ncbi:MAG: hypothetical protein IT439_02475 [Phycisphaerales bacterium]|nr:hypothetical protein [Phycisphaerales bacterium]
MNATLQTEFSIYLADRPGELAGVLEAAAAAGVEITSVSVVDQNKRGLLRVLGEPEDSLRRVFERMVETGAGPVLETPVLVFAVEGRAGLIREVAAKLALSGVNVQYAYGAPRLNGTPGRYVLRVTDIPRARDVIDAIA